MVRSIHALIFAAASGSSTRSAALLSTRSSFTRLRLVVVTIADFRSSLAGEAVMREYSFHLTRCAWLRPLLPERGQRRNLSRRPLLQTGRRLLFG